MRARYNGAELPEWAGVLFDRLARVERLAVALGRAYGIEDGLVVANRIRAALAEVEARGAARNQTVSGGTAVPDSLEPSGSHGGMGFNSPQPAPAPLAEVIARVERECGAQRAADRDASFAADIRRLLDVARKAKAYLEDDSPDMVTRYRGLLRVCL